MLEFMLGVLIVTIKRPRIPEKHQNGQCKERMVVYYQQLLRFIVTITVFTLINVIGYAITGLKFFAAMYCFQLILVSMNLPTLPRMSKFLKLTKEESKDFFKWVPIKE